MQNQIKVTSNFRYIWGQSQDTCLRYMFRLGCILLPCHHDRGQAKGLVPKGDEKFSLRLSYYIHAYLPYVLYN